MSQHLIHVCVTDAPAWSQRERGKSKRRRKSKQTGVGGKKGRWGRERATQRGNEEEREKRGSRQENRYLVNQASQENRTKVKRWVSGEALRSHSCGSAPSVSMGNCHGPRGSGRE